MVGSACVTSSRGTARPSTWAAGAFSRSVSRSAGEESNPIGPRESHPHCKGAVPPRGPIKQPTLDPDSWQCTRGCPSTTGENHPEIYGPLPGDAEMTLSVVGRVGRLRRFPPGDGVVPSVLIAATLREECLRRISLQGERSPSSSLEPSAPLSHAGGTTGAGRAAPPQDVMRGTRTLLAVRTGPPHVSLSLSFQMFKGPDKDIEFIYTAPSSAVCGVSLDIGGKKEYLIAGVCVDMPWNVVRDRPGPRLQGGTLRNHEAGRSPGS